MTCAALTGQELQLCRLAEATEAAVAAAESASARAGPVETFAALSEALTGLILPLVLVFVVWRLWPVLATLIERRTFTIKVAGFELSAQEATDQIRRQIEEMQAELAQLRASGDASEGTSTEATSLPGLTAGRGRATEPVAPPTLQILWVDDMPQNNAFEIAALRDRGHEIITATSTEAAMRLLDEKRVDAILSDMGRPEGRTAGLDMLRALREAGDETPFGFYSTRRSIERNEADMARLGTFVATSTLTDLIRGIARLERETES